MKKHMSWTRKLTVKIERTDLLKIDKPVAYGRQGEEFWIIEETIRHRFGDDDPSDRHLPGAGSQSPALYERPQQEEGPSMTCIVAGPYYAAKPHTGSSKPLIYGANSLGDAKFRTVGNSTPAGQARYTQPLRYGSDPGRCLSHRVILPSIRNGSRRRD
jgi:hypothetical protein